ncbi:MAG TPA: phosphate ABC transporter permease subunit PstC [Egibacteraceae bacterium]|nr:phosphate ABC transporter permease subunit PstC [Egibacteraceae bacterium]
MTATELSPAQPRPPTAVALGLVTRRPRYGEKVIKGLLFLCATLSIATTVAIVLSLVGPTVEFFGEVGIGEFLTGTTWAPLFADPAFGVLPLVTATFVITGIALCLAVPTGLLIATYLQQYARPQARKLLKPTLELLAGIPSVVYGFFALTFVTPILQDLWFVGDPPGIFNAASAGLVMGVMIVPTIASLSEDAMAAVPKALSEGAYALGSNRMTVSTRVVMPAALSGIVAAIVLGVSRAVGETMIVLIAAGGTPNLSFNPAEAMQTMTAFIASAGIGDQPTGSTGYKTIFAVGSTLFLLTLAMNLISIRLVRRYRQVYS